MEDGGYGVTDRRFFHFFVYEGDQSPDRAKQHSSRLTRQRAEETFHNLFHIGRIGLKSMLMMMCCRICSCRERGTREILVFRQY